MAAEASMIFVVLRPLVDKAATIVVDRLDGILHVKRDISKLQTTLLQIESILQEAEEKQIDDAYIQKWLSELVDIGYEVRDVVDDFITSYSVARATRASRSVRFSSLPYSSFLRYFDVGGSLQLRLRFRLAKDIKGVMVRFDEKVKESKKFTTLKSVVGGGGGSTSVHVYRRPEVGPFPDKQSDLFVGRGDEKEGIMEKLLHPSDNRVHVVPIWGMGGIGKTTLAQFVYTDERAKVESIYRRWLCVGEKKFSARDVIMKIIKESGTNDVEYLQTKLVEKLRGNRINRFLIVLDDVWNVDNNEWNLLFNPLTSVGKGGLIIITTRKSEVITATNTLVPDRLSPLSEKDSWLIFESHAFIDGKLDCISDLKPIGQQIVQKLKGLPLALEVVGRSLLNKPDARIWTNFLESKEWILSKNDDDIMPALRWSYNLLPRHLKQCFTYCALFLKDHVFDEKVLVEMWMAHDLIQNVGGGTNQRRPEDIGGQYFKELVYASLLQCVDGKYMMHDMIHDLALLVSNEEFVTANALLSTDKLEKSRHITIIRDDDYYKNLSLCKSKRILTLYIVKRWYYEYTTCSYNDILRDVFNHLKSIRVLVLISLKIIDIPDCICKLRHLRYLDFSETGVTSLPESLCHLHNLQMLAAPFNAILPRNIVNISSLRYVRANFSTCKGVGKLTSLQELSSFSVCEDVNISELRGLRQLRGKLTIKGLANVTRPKDAEQALMVEKLYLNELELEFSRDDDDDNDDGLGETTISEQEQVLNALKCPPNLKYLKIVGYNGLKPPSWMVNGKLVANLQNLVLCNCHQLKFLPPLGVMSSLKHLSLQSMHGVKKLGDEFYGKGINGKVFFPSLESLVLCDMKKLEEWGAITIVDSSSASFFPRLTKLTISGCPRLVSVIPPVETTDSITDVMRSLKHLKIKGFWELTDLTSAMCFPTTIECLYIQLSTVKS